MARPTSKSELWGRMPLGYVRGIPVFSDVDDFYVANYEQIASDHLESLDSGGENPFIEQALWEESEEETRRLVREYGPGSGRLLDVGVGLGRLIAPLSEYERHGVDISWPYLLRTNQTGIECAFARAHELPYADQVFDVVTCTDVLEHVLDLNVAVESILRVLKQDGVLVLRVPYREVLSGYLALDAPYQYSHLRSFDEDSIRLMFERIFNCEVSEWTLSGTYLAPERMRYPLPRGNWAVVRAIKAVGRIMPTLRDRLVRDYFWPVEINVVVRRAG